MWLILALLSAVSASLVTILGKIGLQGIDTSAATALRAIIMGVFLTLVAFFRGKLGLVSTIYENKRAFTYIILSGVAGALSWLFSFWALKFGKVSQVAPVDRLSVVFAIVFAVLFLEEKLSPMGGVGVLLITAGVIIVAMS